MPSSFDFTVVLEPQTEGGLQHLLDAALTAYDSGQRELSLIYLVSVLDELVRDTATQHRIKGRGRSARAVIAELAFQGIIDGTTADVLDQAWDRRNAIVHGRPNAQSPSRDEIRRVVKACREVQAAVQLQAAQTSLQIGFLDRPTDHGHSAKWAYRCVLQSVTECRQHIRNHLLAASRSKNFAQMQEGDARRTRR